MSIVNLLLDIEDKHPEAAAEIRQLIAENERMKNTLNFLSRVFKVVNEEGDCDEASPTSE
jgi:Ni,Fe-hydrogenase III large subunit